MFRHLLFLLVVIGILLSGCDSKSKEDLLQEGIQYSNQGNYRGAIVLFRNALEKDPNFIEARIQLGDVYLESGVFQNAEKEYKKVLLQLPSSKEVILKLSKVYIRSGETQQAIQLLDKNFGVDTGDVEVLDLLGRAYLGQKELVTAEEMFQKGLGSDPDNSSLKLGLARVYFQDHRKSDARILLNQIINYDKQNVVAHYFLAEIESSEGKANRALELYQDLISINSEDLVARYRAGLLSLFQGDVQAARKQAAEISRLDPNSADGFRLQGLISYVTEEYEAATVQLLDSLKGQVHPNSHFYLGLSYYALEQFEQALNQFQKTLDLNPDFVKARNFSALTLLKQGRLSDAVNEAHKSLARDQNNAFAHQILGSAYLGQKLFDQGMAELEIATRLNPDLVGAQLQKGMVRIAQGDVKLGEEDLVQALQMSPETQDIRLLLVSHYLKQQNYAEAISTLNDGLTGEAVDGLLFNVLAGAYFAQGKKEQALAALANAKSANPDYFTPYYNLANYFSTSGDYAAAKQEYLAVLEKDPQQYKALLRLAALSALLGENDQVRQYLVRAQATGAESGFIGYSRYLVSEKDYEESLRVVQKGLIAHPASAELFALHGTLQSGAGNIKAAEESFTRLAELDPERGTSLLVRFYLQRKMPEEAIAVANRLIDESPDGSAGYLLLSSIQLWKKETGAAFSTLEKGLGLVKDRERLEMRLGVLYEQSGDDDRALTTYKKVSREFPEFVPARFAQAGIYHRQGNMKLAQDLYRDVLQIQPSYLPALNNMAYLLTDNYGQSREALEMALKAYRQGGSDPSVMDTLGYVLVSNGKSRDALNVLRRAVELVPDNPTINLHLGMAYADLKEIDKARPYLEKTVMSGAPDERKLAEKLLQGN